MGNQQSTGAVTSAPAHPHNSTAPAMPPAEPDAAAAAAVKPADGPRRAKRRASVQAAAAITAQAAGTTLREQQAAATAATAAPELSARPHKKAKTVAAAAAGDAAVRDQQQQQQEDQPKKSKREAAAEAGGDDGPGTKEAAGQPDTTAARSKKQKSRQAAAAAAADLPAAQKDKAAAAKVAKHQQAPAAATAGPKDSDAAAKAQKQRAPKPTAAGNKQGPAAAGAAGSKKVQQKGDNAPQQQRERGDSKQQVPKPAANKRKGRHEKPPYEPAVELEKALFAAMAASVADPVALGAASLAAQPVLLAKDKKRPLWLEDADNIKLVTSEKAAMDYLKKSAVSFEVGKEPYRKFILPPSLMQLAEAVAAAAQQHGTRSEAYKKALAAYHEAAAAEPTPRNGRQKAKEFPKDSAAGATAAVAAEAAAEAGVAEGIRLEREVLFVAHEAYGDEEGRLAQAVKRVDDDYWAKHRRANATEERRFRLSQQAMKIAEEKLKERKDVAAAAGPGGAAAAAAAAAGAPVQEDEDAPAEDFAADDSQSLAQLVERAVNGELKTASRRPDRVAESRSLAEGHVIHETAAFGHLAGLPVNYRFMGRSQALVLGMQPSPMAGICSKAVPNNITVDGEAYKGVVVATSVVQSGIYQADTDASDGLIMYTGAGENDLNGNKMQTGDQKLNGANRSMVAALTLGVPIRLSRRNDDDSSSSVYGTCLYYDGLYRVVGVCRRALPAEPGRKKGCIVFVFGLKRVKGQPASLSKPIPHFLANKAAKVSKGDEKVRADCLATDLSKGVEAVKVPVVNEIDSTLPPGINPADPADAKFLLKHAKDTELQADPLALNYIKEDVYAAGIAPPKAPKLLLKDSGNPQEAAEAREAEQQIRQALAAADGSGSSTCGVLYNRDVVVATKQQAAHPHNLLKLLNGGMLPYTFDKKGVPVTCDTLRVLHECADWMGCKDENCPQRQLQHGLRFKLEVFKTPRCGWGVQSWEPIPAGALVAVMRGVIMKEEDVEAYLSQKGDSHYLFELLPRGDFTDDGKRLPEGETVERQAKYVLCARDQGGAARFINHSCDPNLYVQPICSGHTDTGMVAIGLCAGRNIPPWAELTYDYGSSFLEVNHGGACMCGAVNCISKRRAQQAGTQAAAAGAVVIEEDS